MKHLVVVLPGIGGSVLEDMKGLVWDAGLADLITLPISHDRLSLSTNPDLKAVGLISSTRVGLRRSRSAWVPGWTVVNGYESLLEDLCLAFPEAIVDSGHPDRCQGNATIVAFPYDFRQSIVQSAERLDFELRKRFEHLGLHSEKGRREKLIIIAHSMGGLVASYLLGPLGRASWCRSLITLGTPHRGAPKALDVLFNGIRVGPIELGGLTTVFRDWASTYELLPTYRAIKRISSKDNSPTHRALYCHELGGRNTFSTRAHRAFDTHQVIQKAWSDLSIGVSPESIALYGYSHPTKTSAVWDAESEELSVGFDHPDWLGADSWSDLKGDGTVPAIAATPLHMAGAIRTTDWLQQRHGPLTTARQIIELVKNYESRGSSAAIRGDSQSGAVIGLDLDDSYVLGHILDIDVTIDGLLTPLDMDRIWVWVRMLTPAGERVEMRLEWAPTADNLNRFTSAFKLTCPGEWSIEVVASRLPSSADRATRDGFVVIDPGRLNT